MKKCAEHIKPSAFYNREVDSQYEHDPIPGLIIKLSKYYTAQLCRNCYGQIQKKVTKKNKANLII